MRSAVSRLRVALVLLATGLSLSCLAGSSAADGPHGLMLVGRGQSDGGVRWAQRARASGTHVITEFTMREADNVPNSGFADAHLGKRDPVAWFVDRDVGPDDEQLLDGVAYTTVDHLRLEFADGTARDITPHPAPITARRKWRSLKHFRFFVVSAPQEPAMARLVAIDRRGKVITRYPLR